MAFYNPPGAPQQGGLTVDSSRYMNAPAAPVVNPFDKAFELKKQAMDMKRMERKEKSDISQEVASNMQNNIFSLGDAAGKFDPDAIMEGGVFNNAELQKRRFTSTLKDATWLKYKNDAKNAGGIADRVAFEQTWTAAKGKEDSKILNEMWSDVESNRMTEKEFNLAVRDNGGAFRDMWKDMSTEKKQEFQTNMMKAKGWKNYTPGYETFWEGTFGTAPNPVTGELDKSDIATSPAAVGLATSAIAGGLGFIPGVRKYIGENVSKGYSAMGYGSGSRQAIQANLDDLTAKGKELGRTKATKKYGATPESEYKDWQKGKDADELKNLRDTKKADPKKFVGQKRLDELELKEGKFKDKVEKRVLDRKENAEKIKAAKAKLGKAPKPLSLSKASLWKGAKAIGKPVALGYIPSALSRYVIGDDTKTKKVTNQTIQTVGTMAGLGSGQIAMMKKIKDIVKKKGMASTLKKIATTGGLKLATSMGAKAILGSVGGVLSGGAMTVVAGGLLINDLHTIYQILSE